MLTKKISSKKSRTEIIRAKIAKLGVREKDIKKAIEWARKGV